MATTVLDLLLFCDKVMSQSALGLDGGKQMPGFGCSSSSPLQEVPFQLLHLNTRSSLHVSLRSVGHLFKKKTTIKKPQCVRHVLGRIANG